MSSRISAIAYYLPESKLTNADLVARFPEWSEEKIYKKIGVKERRVTAEDQYASDLAAMAIDQFFNDNDIERSEIEYLLLCGQNHDYLTPSTACIVQDRVSLPLSIASLDINVGCSGYIYALSLAHSLVASGTVNNVMLVTATTMAKCVSPDDKGLMSLLGDAATVSLITAADGDVHAPKFMFGTDGRGANELIIASSGMHQKTTKPYLYMHGPNVMNFILEMVPKLYNKLLAESDLGVEDIRYFLFHQANGYVLEHLRIKLSIPKEKFLIKMEQVGNTSASSIPLMLYDLVKEGKLKKGDKIMMIAFGGGYSWSGSIWHWS